MVSIYKGFSKASSALRAFSLSCSTYTCLFAGIAGASPPDSTQMKISMELLGRRLTKSCNVMPKLQGIAFSMFYSSFSQFVIVATSIPGPFLKLGKGKGPGIGWSHDTQNIWVYEYVNFCGLCECLHK